MKRLPKFPKYKVTKALRGFMLAAFNYKIPKGARYVYSSFLLPNRFSPINLQEVQKMKPYYDDGKGIQIFLGDCREVLPAIGPVDLVLTDPPYGIDVENHHSGEKGPERYSVINGDLDDSLATWLVDYCGQRSWPLVCFGSPKIQPMIRPKQTLIWDKGPAVGGGGYPWEYWKFTHELIHVWRTGRLNGSRDCSILKYWVTPEDYHFHHAQKPTSLIRYLLAKTTNESHCVLDPFAGSGSTLEAAKILGRRAIGIEIEERYCEIAAKRLSQEVLDFSAK